jgi:predicted AlkP superfamily pyrophosphatase or phosphodiesterase
MQHGVETLRVQLAQKPDLRSPDFLFMLFGDIDYLAHYTGPDSPQTRARVREIDGFVEQIYNESGADRELIVLSDHGHLNIRSKIDVYAYVPELLDCVHQVEDMYVRIWPDNDAHARVMRDRLDNVPGLTVLDEAQLRHHRLPIDPERHGHIIGILDHHLSFLKTSWTRFNKFISDHGYLPDHPDLDAFFAASFLPTEPVEAELVDFLPTVFEVMGISPAECFEGRSLAAARTAPV